MLNVNGFISGQPRLVLLHNRTVWIPKYNLRPLIISCLFFGMSLDLYQVIFLRIVNFQ